MAKGGIVRCLESVESGFRVTLSWSSGLGVSSALVIAESLPKGSVVRLVDGLGPEGESVVLRCEGTISKFLVPMKFATTAGSICYEVSTQNAGGVSGTWMALKADRTSVSGVVGGDVELRDRTFEYLDSLESSGGVTQSAPEEFSEPLVRDIAIRSFTLLPDGNRMFARFAWTGSGTNAVSIQFRETLPSSGSGADLRAAKFSAGGALSDFSTQVGSSESAGWKTIQTVVPGKTPGLAIVATKSLPEGNTSDDLASVADKLMVFSVEAEAPSGFFRLVVSEPSDDSSVEE